jgi:hypothetical protein
LLRCHALRKVGGLSCYVFSRQETLPGPEQTADLLIFIHGGGYVSHLFLADMPVLTGGWHLETQIWFKWLENHVA